MASQVELAVQGIITAKMKAVAKAEGVAEEYVRDMTAQGKIVIPNNTVRESNTVGIGKGLQDQDKREYRDIHGHSGHGP